MAPATKQALRIDVISDTVCPWCFIGKRRLEQALAQRSDRYDFDVHFHPFELNPDLPPEGVEARAHYAEKFGSWERFLEITQRVAGVGSELGIDFAFEKASRSPNTFESHRLVRLAAKAGKQSDVVEALFSAHFVEGRDVGDRETLVAIATEAGLDADEVRASLASDAGVEEVRGAEAEVRRLGVTSVPFFILEGKLAVSGAQPAEAFLQAIDQVAAQTD
jgi:predicted DsbA family dithiol-disulfide isomerase